MSISRKLLKGDAAVFFLRRFRDLNTPYTLPILPVNPCQLTEPVGATYPNANAIYGNEEGDPENDRPPAVRSIWS
jgi:hypothetical protein